MIKEEWKQILEQKEVRQNLSKIRQELKDSQNRRILAEVIAGQEQVLAGLLNSEDAKTRKNAALLMGDLGNQEFLAPIYEAYLGESQRFVKSSYLSAISNFDYRKYMDSFKERLESLGSMQVTQENQKHHMEEMRELSSLIVRIEGVQAHKFCGWDETFDVVLLSNRNFTELVKKELVRLEPNAKAQVFNAGVMARVTNLPWAEELRSYQELLFYVKRMKTCPMDPAKAADIIVKSGLFDFLAKCHRGETPYYFRVEMKSKRELSEKSVFVKKLSGLIEKLSGRRLINTTDHYEFEIRLIENKEGNFNLLVKLFTLRDERFSYRKEVMPTSIRPVNASLTAALAREYMRPDAQVLDPFCGVGTMLVERHKAVKANTMYGIDVQEEAVLKARKNTEAAGQIIHYINRDFFSFQHEYLFDEVITNMPFQIGRITQDEIYELYRRFFSAIPQHLKGQGRMILYSHDRDYVKKLSSRHGFDLLEEFEISRKEGTYVFVLEYKEQKESRC